MLDSWARVPPGVSVCCTPCLQVRAIAEALLYLAAGPLTAADASIDEALDALDSAIGSDGLDALRPGWRLGTLARPRSIEVHAALSRLRGLQVAQTKRPRTQP